MQAATKKMKAIFETAALRFQLEIRGHLGLAF